MTLSSSAMNNTSAGKQREVASGVVNLGNTCYMNCVLQALAHAPELCLAVDHESHSSKCPIGRQNRERRRNSPSPPGEQFRKRPSRKSRRSSGKKSPSTDSEDSTDFPFCTLCELEEHIHRVHSAGRQQPVAPSSLVHGFLDHVAPNSFKLGVQEDSHEFLRLLIDAMQKSCRGEDDTYPFKLFRGKIESNVSCSSCQATSSTIDPMEDLGLEVTSSLGPTPINLSDVSSALSTFTHEEPLTGYKCDKCGNTGRATKRSLLADIPPILTLHLKRFRYGADGKLAMEHSTYSRRAGRELAQLLGASGSAKIEGHAKFQEIFDLKPFLTKEKSNQVKSMFCRLFAVIVHAGKNSHSGHYVAYVRNISKNEWWKTDDARVTRVSNQEVFNAEAYMLFYRVMEHPIAQELRVKAAKVEQEQQQQQQQEQQKQELSVQDKTKNTPEASSGSGTTVPASTSDERTGIMPNPPATAVVVSPAASSSPSSGRKRKRDETREFADLQEWARTKTNIPLMKIFPQIEEYISDNVEFKPKFSEFMSNEARKGANFAISVCEDDVQGGLVRFRPLLLKFLNMIFGNKSFFRKGTEPLTKTSDERGTSTQGTASTAHMPLAVMSAESNDTFL